MSINSKKKYNCVNCCYYTDNKYDWAKHISRPKHIINVGNINKFACECGKKYKYQSGLSRHKSKCKLKNKLQNKNEYCDILKKITNGKLTTDEQLTAVLKVMMQQQETINKLIETQGEIIPKIGNNNNNKININVFLNERCKNAMNLNEFISKIKVSMEDLDYTHNNGFVKGISNIFTKQLNDLEITERPIHCSNTKKLQFYIKDDDIWRKDTYHKKLNRMNLHSPEISKQSSMIAKIYKLRKILKVFQTNFAKKNQNCCIEGRDISTEILPDSDVKFFFKCNLSTAAVRRYRELKKGNNKIKLKDVKKALRIRNNHDIKRKNSPLLKHGDAIEIDTGKLNKQAMLSKMSKYVDIVIKKKYGN